MSATTAFYFDERCLWHSTGLHALVVPVGGWVQPPAGAGHAESPETKRRIKTLMDVSGLSSQVDVRSAAAVSEEELLRVHPAGYLRQFRLLSEAGGGDLGQLAPFGRGSYEIARLSAGLVAAAIESVLTGSHRNAYALSRPPGHHCLPDLPMGFCMLANIPIAIEAAIARHGLERVAVVDWDVHHGNGTQAIYYERPDVLTISLHQDRCFPPGYGGLADRGSGRGTGYNYNIPLQPGGGDDAYRYAFERIVLPVLDRYRPQLIEATLSTHGLYCSGNLKDDFLPFADHKSIYEIGHRFGVITGMTTCNDQWVTRITILTADGHSCQIKHIEHVGEELLVGQTDSK